MRRIKVVLEARGPLLLGDGLPAGNVQSSRPFVAGSVLRGTLARAILLPQGLWGPGAGRGGAVPEEVRRVFLEEPVARFGFLYPVREAGESAGAKDAFPIPLTARTCKSHRGFRSDGGHGVLDGLPGRLRRVTEGPGAGIGGCPVCGERLERMRGFAVRGTPRDPATCRESPVHPRAFVRVGLNRGTETAEEGILYTLEALVPGPGGEGQEQPLSFTGYWVMEDDQWQTLRGLIRRYLPEEDGAYPLRIGSARARGMGAVTLRWLEEPDGHLPPLEERLEAFQPRGAGGEPLDPAHLYFALTLRAPLLLYDPWGRPAARPDPPVLEPYVSRLPESLEFLPEASEMEREDWTGWSAAWGLPKPVVSAIGAGSVLAFRASAGEREAVLAFLREVEENGLGEHRAEGWGEAVACDPFHIVLDASGGPIWER